MKNSTAIILILISVGLFYTFTSSEYAKVQVLESEQEKYKEVLSGADAISEAGENLESSYEKVPKEEVARLAKILPDNVDTVKLALDLDGLAGKYGISVKKIRVEKSQSEIADAIEAVNSALPYEKILISFSFISDYADFTGFLNDIERNARIMNIKEISFQPSESGLYEHNMTVETFWLK